MTTKLHRDPVAIHTCGAVAPPLFAVKPGTHAHRCMQTEPHAEHTCIWHDCPVTWYEHREIGEPELHARQMHRHVQRHASHYGFVLYPPFDKPWSLLPPAVQQYLIALTSWAKS